MRFIIAFIISFSLSYTEAWSANVLTTAECKDIVMDLEKISNLNPSAIESKAPEALNQLRNGETLPSYFIAYNIYVENLFNKGNIEKARKEIEQMIHQAFAQNDKECQVIALRSQGQFYYKLGLYDRAADCFRYAMELCPNYDSKLLENCFTWSSTLFWLVQSDIRIGNINEAEYWIGKTDEMIDWLESFGNVDCIGYKPVMIRGLKAKIELNKGNLDEARRWLDQCPQFIREDIPARAYVEYYVAKMQLYLQQNMHHEALPLLDQLIEMHINDYKPIAAEYIFQKGLSLAEVGKYEESTQTLKQYIELKKQIDEISVTQQLDELTTRYKVEKLQHEKDNLRKRFLIALSICIALIFIVGLIIISQRKLKHKNQILAHNISELNRLAREVKESSSTLTNEKDDLNSPNYFEIGTQIVDYINQTKCYLRFDCSRDTIKNGLGISDRIIAKAITAVSGLSFVNYINQLRLNLSIEMLEEKPEMNINEISSACGFGSVRQFQRIFKQRYDLTPSAYRDATRSPKP